MEKTEGARTCQLVDEAVRLKREEKQIKAKLSEVNAELTELCERVIRDKGVKSSVVYGTDGNSVIVTSPVKTTVVSYQKLVAAMGEGMVNEYAPWKAIQPERKPTDEFAQVMSDVVLDNYLEGDLGTFLGETFKLTAEQKSVLVKKLKGLYDKDRKVLVAVLGEGDYDVELYHIARILNYQRIRRHLPDEPETAMDAIKSAVAVDEGVRIEIVYKD